MTDSRVEAVRKALQDHMNLNGPICSDTLSKAAIEANDAWLKARGWKAVPRVATEKMIVDGACCLPETPADSFNYSVFEPGNQVMRDDAFADWERMWESAPPTPEDTDR